MNMLPSERHQQKLSLLPCCEGSSIARKDNETDEEQKTKRRERKEPTASLRLSLLSLPTEKNAKSCVYLIWSNNILFRRRMLRILATNTCREPIQNNNTLRIPWEISCGLSKICLFFLFGKTNIDFLKIRNENQMGGQIVVLRLRGWISRICQIFNVSCLLNYYNKAKTQEN